MSGWFPDPTGRYDLRFHNGSTWTADVASAGQRFVDRMPITPPPARRSNGTAVAAMVCGITGLAVGWVPFLAFLAVVTCIVAVVLAIAGLRRAKRGDGGHGFAIAGLVTGGVGTLVAVGGIVLTFVLVRLISEFENPGPVTAEVVSCTASGDFVTLDGWVRNLDDDSHDYSVQVELARGSSERRRRVTLDGVGVGEQVAFTATARLAGAGQEPVCRVVAVDGPLPFGIDIGSTDGAD